MDAIKVVLADSHLLTREGLKTILKSETNIKIVGEIIRAEELVNEINRLLPNVVLIDYLSHRFKTSDIQKLKTSNPDIQFVAITEYAERNLVRRAMQAGISGHILKSCDRDEIVDSINCTHEGTAFYCGKILDTLRDPSSEGKEVTCDPIKLSAREIDIIREIAAGKTNKQIAEDNFLSTHTVMTHRKNIMQKLGIKNTAGMVIYAVKENLISPNRFLFEG